MKTNTIHHRLWLTQLELIQVCYRNRLSQPVEQFITLDKTPGELSFDETMALDPAIRRQIQTAYDQIFNRNTLDAGRAHK